MCSRYVVYTAPGNPKGLRRLREHGDAEFQWWLTASQIMLSCIGYFHILVALPFVARVHQEACLPPSNSTF
jgi:hypothetical protein